MEAMAADASQTEEEEGGIEALEVSGEDVEREGDGRNMETEDGKEDEEGVGVETTAGANASEQRCPVCLGDFQNKAFIDACFHIPQRPLLKNKAWYIYSECTTSLASNHSMPWNLHGTPIFSLT